MHEGLLKSASKASSMPHRSQPPPPSSVESARNASPSVPTLRTDASSGPIGAFWTTRHGKDSAGFEEISKLKFDQEPTNHQRSRSERLSIREVFFSEKSPPVDEAPHSHTSQQIVHGKAVPSKDFELKKSLDNPGLVSQTPKARFNDAFNAFAAEFGINKRSSGGSIVNSRKEELLEAEVERLREQLKQANMEKSEINSKYEKLSAICRSQRQQLRGLKQALASSTPPNKSASKSQPSPGIQQQSPFEQGLFGKSSSSPDQNSWQAFPEDLKTPTLMTSDNSKPFKTRTATRTSQVPK